MTCESCGEKPKNHSKDFTKAVIEINNPETLILFRKVVIPASMGDDTTYPPEIGKFHNVLLFYEANKHGYLYSSDGIPTQVVTNADDIEALIAQLREDLTTEASTRELADSNLQQEIDDLRNAPDVVDIVDTYADLQAYDTSSLGDKDVIRVLADETHGGDSSYYRWSTGTQTWTYIGSIHIDERAFKPFPDSVVTDGTTQQFFNSILALQPEVGMAYLGTVELSDMPAGLIQEEVEVYVYNDYVVYGVMRSTDVAPYQWWAASYNYGGWRPVGGTSNTIFYANLNETGTTRHIYKNADMTGTVSVQDILDANLAGQVILRMSTAQYPSEYNDAYLQNTYIGTNDYQFLFLDNRIYYEYDASATSDTSYYYSTSTIQLQLNAGANITINGNTISATDTTYSNFVGTDGLIAGTAGLVPAPATTDAGKYLKADGTWDTAGSTINVVQTTGTSQTDVMSQNAVTSTIYADPGTNQKVQIGTNGVTASGTKSVAIGVTAKAAGDRGVAISEDTAASGYHSVAIGFSAKASGISSVALGKYAKATERGQFDISTSALSVSSTDGYNNTAYRLLTGLYDGQSAHDAATLAQANTLSSAAPTTTTAGVLGQLYSDTTNGDLYHCTAIDTTDPQNPVYTWDIVGGGSGPTVVQTTGTSQSDVMSQNATTAMIYADPGTNSKVRIGTDTNRYINNNGILIGSSTNQPIGSNSVKIGYTGYAGDNYGVSVGYNTYSAGYAVGIGSNAAAGYTGSVAIGGGSSLSDASQARAAKSISIGSGTISDGNNGIAIGTSAASGSGNANIAIGYNAKTYNNSLKYTVCIGAGSQPSASGEMNIGCSREPGYGYNNSDYRLLSGVYDGQSAHDAATKGQLDAIAIQNAGAPTSATVGSVGQLLLDTTNGKLYICTAVTGDGGDPEVFTYTWVEIVTKDYVDGMITVTSVDPGEGSPLAAGKFIAVYTP